MRKPLQKKFLIPLIATVIIAICVVTTVCVFAEKDAKTMNTSPETGDPITEPVTEPVTEVPTEPPTEAPTEPPTEAPTEPPTEAPTEAPIEPPTEAPTEPEIEFTIIARDTMLDGGTPVEFNIMSNNFSGGFRFEKINSRMLIAPIKNGTEYDYQRSFYIFTARSAKEFESNFISLVIHEYPIIDKYNESYFEKSAVLILLQGGSVNEVVKNGAELSICASTRLDKPDDTNPCVVRNPVTFIEVNKADLYGVDTVSFFVEAE